MAKAQTQTADKARSREVARSKPTTKLAPGHDVIQGPQFTRKNYLLLGVATATIALGFITLARGSMTLAPALIVAGYLVLVPLAILKR